LSAHNYYFLVILKHLMVIYIHSTMNNKHNYLPSQANN
jgi:hypothetical protein